MDKRIEEINKAREEEKRQWAETDVRYGGKKAGYKQGEARMDNGNFDEFDPINKYNYSSEYRDLREKMQLIIRESQPGYWDARTELARINYTEKMDKILGNHPIGKMLLKKIKGLDLKDFKRTLKGEDDLFLLLYQIEKEPDNFEILLEEVWNEWFEEDMYEALDDYISKNGG